MSPAEIATIGLLRQLLAPGTIVDAIYAPSRWDSVPDWAVPLLERRRRWVAQSIIESAPHAGQWAMAACALRVVRTTGIIGGVVPLEHLHGLRIIGRLANARQAGSTAPAMRPVLSLRDGRASGTGRRPGQTDPSIDAQG